MSRAVNQHVYPTDDVITHELKDDRCICGPQAEPIKDEDEGAVSWLYHHVSLRTGKIAQIKPGSVPEPPE